MKNTQPALSPYSRNILQELKKHADRLLKVREPDLIRLSQVPSVRIIEARDEVDKSLHELKEHNLITYEIRGDRYIIRSASARE